MKNSTQSYRSKVFQETVMYYLKMFIRNRMNAHDILQHWCFFQAAERFLALCVATDSIEDAQNVLETLNKGA